MGQSRTHASVATLYEHGLRLASQHDVPVLVTCRDSAERARYARIIHATSTRAGGPFIELDGSSVRCDVTPPTSRGAHLDTSLALQRSYERAYGGSLFIDHVESLPLACQLQLLRLLDVRLRCRRDVAGEGRIIAGAASPVCPLVAAGAFSAALFYRLNVIHLDLLSQSAGDQETNP